MSDALIPVFDGHNDTLLRFARAEARQPEDLFRQDGGGHFDLPRARAGGFVGGLFAAFTPSNASPDVVGRMEGTSYDLPLPPQLSIETAQGWTARMFAILLRLERSFPDDLAVCRSVADIRSAMAQGKLAAVFHIEGAEAIDPDFMMLDVLHAAGLRSLGPVWSRPNRFGHGVPFRFPATPDIGPWPDRGRSSPGAGLQ